MKLFNSLLILFMLCISSIALASNGTGTASWYGGDHHEGRFTASGERFNGKLMTAASNSHKMGTMLKVTNINNGKSVTVKVNDTGGFSTAKYGYRALDLSKSAFATIAPLGQGLVKVKYEVVGFQPVVRHPASYKSYKQKHKVKKYYKKSYKKFKAKR